MLGEKLFTLLAVLLSHESSPLYAAAKGIPAVQVDFVQSGKLELLLQPRALLDEPRPVVYAMALWAHLRDACVGRG